jgi:cysteine desulfurase / selenocysteine lyase
LREASAGAPTQVIVSVAEHHANIVPWQLVCAATGAMLRHVGLTANQELDIDDLAAKMSDKTKLVALMHVSNVLGSRLPEADVAGLARKHGARLLLDCCQSVPHMPVDVQARSSLHASPHAGGPGRRQRAAL